MTDRPIATSRRGAPITEEQADQLADEAEHGYDLTRGRRVVPAVEAGPTPTQEV